MSIPEITFESGIKAFEETGLEPRAGQPYDENGCGCLAGALYLQANPNVRGRLGPPNIEYEANHFIQENHLWDMVFGFDCGFRGDWLFRTDKSSMVGYEIGLEMRKRFDSR